MSGTLSVSKARQPRLHEAERREIYPPSTLGFAGRLLGGATACRSEPDVCAIGTGASLSAAPAHLMSLTTTWESEPWI